MSRAFPHVGYDISPLSWVEKYRKLTHGQLKENLYILSAVMAVIVR
jgi:hypothetical protein